MMDKYRRAYCLESNAYYYEKLQAEECRYDEKEVLFIKKLLQRELPEKLRKIIVDFLFNEYVCADEGKFARELYMGIDQLKHLRGKNMYIGSHGYDHYWLNTLSREQQSKEIKLSLSFLKNIDNNFKKYVFSYPYGAYNENLLSVLKETGCVLGLTTRPAIANIPKDKNNTLLLPRLDTNDLPQSRGANHNKWTLAAIGS
jgi:peptidoglycan/xylan/chitin deacetylase (PgdA/CDA1 family)